MNILKRSWDLEIVAQGALGVCRFEDFQRHLGISRKVLSERLKWLTSAEIVERRKYQSAPDRYEYVLTDKGRDLLPILAAMMQWEERWER
ncbi:winged helix-turn-helix transcriptional regulator [Nocardioides pocheonensis]|uniref:Transcriptional regulator n=1 Tax=Nocardioides pocheonensis TaxID=661485 RepID=A0A3N0GI15_9ACTN|nr:helix-turn-helix domain-containing protein [Nocardioides pocheonensis]RNM12091.1 transcriptional regulator [Nocardioides pocheonensis]